MCLCGFCTCSDDCYFCGSSLVKDLCLILRRRRGGADIHAQLHRFDPSSIRDQRNNSSLAGGTDWLSSPSAGEDDKQVEHACLRQGT